MVELKDFDQILSVIEDPEQKKKWEEITRWQAIDTKLLKEELSSQKDEKNKLRLIWGRYPSLHIYILQAMNKHSEAQKYMRQCKQDESYHDEYSFYVHAYWMPFLDQQRAAGKLTHGKTNFLQSTCFSRKEKNTLEYFHRV